MTAPALIDPTFDKFSRSLLTLTIFGCRSLIDQNSFLFRLLMTRNTSARAGRARACHSTQVLAVWLPRVPMLMPRPSVEQGERQLDQWDDCQGDEPRTETDFERDLNIFQCRGWTFLFESCACFSFSMALATFHSLPLSVPIGGHAYA
jgi:hypothetical protein